MQLLFSNYEVFGLSMRGSVSVVKSVGGRGALVMVSSVVKDRLTGVALRQLSCDTVSHLVASFVAAVNMYGWKELRQTSGLVRLNRTSATCACRGFVRCLKSSCWDVGVVLVEKSTDGAGCQVWQ